MNFIKLLHVLSIIIWMGTLFTLQLFNSKVSVAVQEVSKKILSRIDRSALCVSIITGFVLLYLKGVDLKAGWFHMKMTGVIALMAVDFWTGRLIYSGRACGWGVRISFYLALLLVLSAIYIVKVRAAFGAL
jgi:uncharacterized membrane protein